jgi:hypothetical protein
VPAAPIIAGLYLSEEQVLARPDREASTWEVLPVNSSLMAGEVLQSLPTYRPQILVAKSAKITLSGESSLKLRAPDATNVPHIEFAYGKATIVPVGEMGESVKLEAGGRAGVLVFDDADSSAAIEVRRYLPPGADPFTDSAQVVVQIYCVSGGLNWQEPDHALVSIPAGQGAWFLDKSDVNVFRVAALPTWTDGRNLSDIERRASKELLKFLVVERNLVLSLMEQTNSRQVEVRSLACRALCYLDDCEPALEALGNDQFRSYWHALLDAVQAHLAEGPDQANRVRASLGKLFMDHAESVFRLLRGYSPDQLSAGGAAELVEHLGSPSMVVRVLAYENLRRITGKTLQFRPEQRPDLEKSRGRWRKLAEDGQVGYAVPPSPLTGLPAAAGDSAKSQPASR